MIVVVKVVLIVIVMEIVFVIDRGGCSGSSRHMILKPL